VQADRRAAALALAIALGVLAQYLFVRELVGTNVVVLDAGILGGAWALRRRDAVIDRRDMWLAIGALAFAALCAVRVDAPLLAFNLTASLILTAGAVVSLRGVSVWRLPLPQLAGTSTATLAHVAGDAPSVIRAGIPVLATGLSSRSARVSAYAGGALLAIPFVVVFGALFSSADAVFRHLVESAVDLAALRQLLAEVPVRAEIAVVVTWVAAGVFAALTVTPVVRGRSISRIAAVETAATFLVIVDLLFTVFVALQVVYLFGGRDTLDAAGITYSTYGRSGFFELVAVACIVALLLLGLDLVVGHRSVPYVLAALALVALSGVILASAWYRMDLYQRAYGWSELRFYAFAGIAYIAVALAILAMAVARSTMPLALQRLALAASIAAILVNLLSPSDLVARHNLERAIDPSSLPADAWRGLDVAYLISLGDGALPATLELLPSLPEPEASLVRDALRALTLRRPSAEGWQSWNFDRERARSAAVRASAVETAHIR